MSLTTKGRSTSNQKNSKSKKRRKKSKIPAIWFEYKENPTREVRNQLIEKYHYIVRYKAERMVRKLPNNVELDDLISAGTFGLMDAIRGFDPHRGVKFETYCSLRIHGAILDELRSTDWVPRLVRTKSHKLKRKVREVEQKLGRSPSDHEMAEEMGLSIEEFTEVVREAKAVTIRSLNERWTDGAGGQGDNKALRKIDLVEDEQSVDPAEKLQKKDILDLASRYLTQKEELILVLYYFEDLTLREIGACIDLSESRVCQLHRRIIDKLAKHFEGRRIELFF